MVDGVSAAASGSGLGASRKSIADNFDTFLQLLIVQLRNQNPLEPMDTNQFTQQLVQFTSVEQQLKTNEFLEAMLLSSQSNAHSQAVGYIGKIVSAQGAQTELINGQALWAYRIEEPAAATTVTIRDAVGNIVFTETLSLEAGTDYLSWDGVGTDGTRHTSGRFTITIDARTASGAYVPVTTELRGLVTGVDMSGTEPSLIVGDMRLPLSSVTALSLPERDPAPQDPPPQQPD